MSFRFQTRRLILRPWREPDRPSLVRMTSDEEMMRFINGRRWTPAEVDEMLERQQRHLKNHGICFGAAERVDTSDVVGLVGMQPLASGGFEIGWWIRKDQWRQGLASEAAGPFVAHAASMGLERLWAIIYPQNAASIGVAEKLGMQRDRKVPIDEVLPGRGEAAVFVYRLDLDAGQGA